ncbi:hypothetical protein Misp06_00221 [Microbulbifer sp. NBRC 101763]|uniref:hypothetical protein n=1 Tax=unclassified Microbulbifer TaxID=2619833 RepID=UPI0024AD539E|nr:hypothetical protein [Microbulbifer sp. MLAF003]WHI49997.1 hypothetical protein P3339_16275 [Microbulbifer sp. MLAF003]
MDAKIQIQELLRELYKVISGPAGYKRDWKRQQNLFTSYAKVIRTSADSNGEPQSLVMDIQDYPDNFQELIGERAFYEDEIQNIIEVFGNIAHAFSTYEAWKDEERTQFLKRGINSIQLYHDGKSWKITNMIWDDERPGLTVPAKYMPKTITETNG